MITGGEIENLQIMRNIHAREKTKQFTEFIEIAHRLSTNNTLSAGKRVSSLMFA